MCCRPDAAQVQALHCGLDAAAVSDSVLRAGQCVVTGHCGERLRLTSERKDSRQGLRDGSESCRIFC